MVRKCSPILVLYRVLLHASVSYRMLLKKSMFLCVYHSQEVGRAVLFKRMDSQARDRACVTVPCYPVAQQSSICAGNVFVMAM